MTTITKYFNFTTGITQSYKNIAYKNGTCTTMNKHLRNKLNKINEYEVGEVLICKNYVKLKILHLMLMLNMKLLKLWIIA